MWRGLVLIGIAAALCGCAHNLTFVSRENGERGSATVTAAGRGGGDIQIELAGKTYRGTWVYVANGGAIGFGTATAFSGVASATASGMMLSESTAGGGTILASAEDGSTLRCQFTYNQMGATGVGMCQDSLGGTYDLQIR